MKGNFAFLKESSPFFDLFGRGAVPIVNVLLPNLAELEGSSESKVYMVDVNRLTPEQFHGICERLAQKSGCDPWDVRRELMFRGLPLRASQVQSVSIDQLWFL